MRSGSSSTGSDSGLRRLAVLAAGLLLALACARFGRAPRVEPPAPLPAATPVATPAPPPPAPGPAPAPPPAVVAEPFAREPALPPAGELKIRVGLATDLSTVTVPCCDGEVSTVLGDGTPLAAMAPVRVEPAPAAVGTAYFRLQVGALKDEVQARGLAERAGAIAEAPADARFDPRIDLYRVRVGRYASREAA
ncbi:MAG TPA: SPOR domain-containing protein, partial [Thermoanaerobaculia bacterium]|nr:SPOR domain-containing protein [Thermoanaerobaculia bacterium]